MDQHSSVLDTLERGTHPLSPEEIRYALRVHEVLLAKGCLERLATRMEGAAQMPEARFHVLLASTIPQGNWAAVYDELKMLLQEAQNPLLAFYLHDYLFVFGRGLQKPEADLDGHYTHAFRMGSRVEKPLQHLLLGRAMRHWGDYLRVRGSRERALGYYQGAISAFLQWYRAQSEVDADARALVATDLWWLRHHWATLFPNVPLQRSGIDDALFAELATFAKIVGSPEPAIA